MSDSNARTPAVVVDGVSKSFTVPRERVHTLKERALHPLRRRGSERFDALKDVSFTVERGEFFGIVGRNGSGKSTLLKCLAGIYGATTGSMYLDGRVSTFIELGVGFNPDLAARDNMIINATMLGLSPREARERFEHVIEFAELEEFTDLKLKNYSSGMQVRLAFSVMIQVDADILIIDEVLAVGDASFQQKCFEVFQRLRDEGKTIIFVTHDMGAVQRFCDRAMLLERGVVRSIGEPDRIGSQYLEINFGRDGGQQPVEQEEEKEERYGDRCAEILESWFEDHEGKRSATLTQHERCTFRVRVRFDIAVENPVISVMFEDDQRHQLFATTTKFFTDHEHSYEPGDEVIFSASFVNSIGPGRLWATPWVAYRESENLMDRRPRMASAMILAMSRRWTGALVDLPHDIELERVGESVTARATL